MIKLQNSQNNSKQSFAEITDHINTLKYSTTQKDSPKPPYPNTVVPDNRRFSPLEFGKSTEIGGTWNMKYEISSTRIYELLIKAQLKGDTAIDLNNLYNHIKMCLNAVTII